jgi:two-component system, LytTR family, response regulator
MDIQLIDGICFSIFDQRIIESMVIFTTAYDEYALQAFEVNSIDYILKPIKEVKLHGAIDKFERFSENVSQSSSNLNYDEIMKVIVGGDKKYRNRFLIATATSYFKINTSDIAMFFTENRLTYAITFAGKRHPIDLTMEKLEGQLNPDNFFRANRSTIVNSEAIHKIENYFAGKLYAHLVSPITEQITISRLKATEFKNWLGR